MFSYNNIKKMIQNTSQKNDLTMKMVLELNGQNDLGKTDTLTKVT